MPYYSNKFDFFAEGLEPYTEVEPLSTVPQILHGRSQPPTSGSLTDATGTGRPVEVTKEKQSNQAEQQEGTHQEATEIDITAHIRLALTIEPHACPICLEELTDEPVAVRIRACNHAYHRDCLEPWVEHQNTCPACRCVLFGSHPQPVRVPPYMTLQETATLASLQEAERLGLDYWLQQTPRQRGQSSRNYWARQAERNRQRQVVRQEVVVRRPPWEPTRRVFRGRSRRPDPRDPDWESF